MKLVWIAHCIPDIRHGQFRQFQEFGGFCHAVGDQKCLGGFPGALMEYFPKVTSVQPTGGGDIFHRDVVLEVLLDIGESFLNIKVTQAVPFSDLCGGGSPDKAVYEQIEMPDQMKRGLFLVVYYVQNFIFHGFRNVFVARTVDRLIGSEARQVYRLLGAQAVKFNPCIFPGNVIIGDVHAYLIREDHKTLPALDLVTDGFTVGVFGEQSAGAGEAIVEQIVISGRWPKRMGGCALFPSKLIQPKIHKIFTGKYGKDNFAHG